MEERQIQILDAKNRLASAILGQSDEDTIVPVEVTLKDFLESTL